MILPDDFVAQTEKLFGTELWNIAKDALKGEPEVSIRLNPFKCDVGVCKTADDGGEVSWCNNGFYLSGRKGFTFDPLFHAGVYYVQEASSMFLDFVLRSFMPDRPLMALDLCAAPGGKSTVARAALPENSLLISNEPIKTRAQILAENMQKFGHPDVIVTNNYPQDIRRSGLTFDVIIADVPCSGEGMFRKDETAIKEWNLKNVDKCWRLQREIVTDAWHCLRDGGLFVYSTCTFNSLEDEENILYMVENLGAEVLGVSLDDEWNITGSLLPALDKPVFRFIPGRTRGEGLFMAVLRKTGNDDTIGGKGRQRKGRFDRKTKENGKAVKPDMSWLKQPDKYELIKNDNAFYAVSKAWKDVYMQASSALHVLSAGVPLGEIKGKDIVPSHALALSAAFDVSSFHKVELEYSQAMSYLRKDAVSLPAETPTGYVLLTFRNVPIGFCKNIGNRANNLYPAEWKIKSTHIPDAYTEIIKLR